jgi:hypothetical protein
MADSTELRVQLPPEEVSVLDGYCQGTGQDRTKVIRRILKDWSDAKLHECIVVLRVAGRNPPSSEGGRQ